MHEPSHDGNPDPIFSTILAEFPELWDVVDQFARGLPGHVDEMQDALEGAAYERLVQSARSLITAGRGHGFPELAHQAAAVEQAARDQVFDDLELNMLALRELANQIRAGIEIDPMIGR